MARDREAASGRNAASNQWPYEAERQQNLPTALRACRTAFFGVAFLSGATNVLALTGSFFMLDVYDRVLPSHSIPTLVGLSVLAGLLYLFQGLLEVIRSRLLVRIGLRLDEELSGPVYAGIMRSAALANARGNLSALRDLDQLRTFFSGLGPTALFDLPWMPFYLVICFLFHPLIGLTAICGAAVLFLMTLATELGTRGLNSRGAREAERRMVLAEMGRRNAEAVQALGMREVVAKDWLDANQAYLATQQRVSDIAGCMATCSKVFRMMLQSFMLALGAYLVIQQQATGGIMIASSILMTRALAPVELAIANWAGFLGARRSWWRLGALLEHAAADKPRIELPAPVATLQVHHVSGVAPGTDRLIIRDVTFELKAGEALGVIGPSGSGKSSMIRLLVGVWQPVGGLIKLDGASLDQWNDDVLGKHLGYLPQDVDLLSGTVAQNIARFSPEAKSADIIAAAEAAGVHQLILGFSGGYDMHVGERGSHLSAGQRQRIALARALYGNPFLVVLDEPNSNLDGDGEQALSRAILGVRARGGVVVIVAHRPSALVNVGKVMILKDGSMEKFGDRDAVLGRFIRPPVPSRPVEVPGGEDIVVPMAAAAVQGAFL